VFESLAEQAAAEIIRRIKVRGALTAQYETAPGPEYCVRRLEVVEEVARALGIRVLNNDLFLDVERRAHELGWESVKNGGRSLFRRVRRRELDDAEALALGRSNRYDPRTGRRGPSGSPGGSGSPCFSAEHCGPNPE